VTLAEANTKVGGRVAVESRLPGLAQWARVNDYRAYQISQMANVETYFDSALTAEQVLEFEADHVVLATGSKWRRDGVGRSHSAPIPVAQAAHILTPDNISAGKIPEGPVVVFDDDYYYMGGIMAEKLRSDGLDVTYVTPAADVSHWTHNTMEQARIQTRLMTLGVNIVPLHTLSAVHDNSVELTCIYTGRKRELPCRTTVLVTMRDTQDSFYHLILQARASSATVPKSITRIGDCLAPGTIAAAVYSGHRFARELGEPVVEGVPFRRELPALAAD